MSGSIIEINSFLTSFDLVIEIFFSGRLMSLRHITPIYGIITRSFASLLRRRDILNFPKNKSSSNYTAHFSPHTFCGYPLNKCGRINRLSF